MWQKSSTKKASNAAACGAVTATVPPEDPANASVLPDYTCVQENAMKIAVVFVAVFLVLSILKNKVGFEPNVMGVGIMNNVWTATMVVAVVFPFVLPHIWSLLLQQKLFGLNPQMTAAIIIGVAVLMFTGGAERLINAVKLDSIFPQDGWFSTKMSPDISPLNNYASVPPPVMPSAATNVPMW